MILRTALDCGTCGHHHVTRIGLGHEPRQEHRFACRDCGEDIVVAVEADHEVAHAQTLAIDNCIMCPERPGGAIVNLDANFVVPAELQGIDMVMPRMQQVMALAKEAEASGTLQSIDLEDLRLSHRPFRRQDFGAEWRELRRAWTLHRRGQVVLSRGVVKKMSDALYPGEPLQGLHDWLFRLSQMMTGRVGQSALKATAERIETARDTHEFKRFREWYKTHAPARRGLRYLMVLSDYFASQAQFGQVQFLVTGGAPPDPAAHVASTDFDGVRMFYGNAFEALADEVDVLALLNNTLQGRAFDAFETLTLREYQALDKFGRHRAFAAEPDLASLTAEFDNQIRNASHHGGMTFEPAQQLIRYRAGKDGTGFEQTITYTAYLVGCVQMLSQLLRLLCLELILFAADGVDFL